MGSKKTKLAEYIGPRIKKVRKAAEMTQEDLVEKMNNLRPSPLKISASYISRLESGKHSMNLDMIDRISEGLGIDSVDLLIDTTEDVIKDTIGKRGGGSSNA